MPVLLFASGDIRSRERFAFFVAEIFRKATSK